MSGRRFPAAIASACLLAGGVAAVGAAERPTVAWLMSSRASSVDPVWFEKWQPIAAFDTRFPKAYRLDADYLDGGNWVLPSGSVLIALDAAATSGCIYARRMTKPVARPSDGRKISQLGCLIDRDGDGMFETYSPKVNFFTRAPFSGDRAIAPLRYHALPAADIPSGGGFIMTFGGTNRGKAIFAPCHDLPKFQLTDCFSPFVEVPMVALPQEFDFLGARFRLDGVEKNRVKVTQVSKAGEFVFRQVG